MRVTKQQLEENYQQADKEKGIYMVACNYLIHGEGKKYRKGPFKFMAVGLERMDGGIVIDYSNGYASAHYLDDMVRDAQHVGGPDRFLLWEVLEEIKRDRATLLLAKENSNGQ